jgi:hypothetical protein
MHTPAAPTESPAVSFTRRLALGFAVEVLVLTAFSAPEERFLRWAYWDIGSDLTIPTLTTRGLRPTVDFGYIYGLLPLWGNRLWQGVFGATPGACQGAKLVCALGLAWGMARFATTARVGAVGIVLTALAMPDILRTSALVLVHSMEPALLVNALALQAAGRRGPALALATACLFVKPSMAYLYGLVLLASVVLNEPGRARTLRTLAPAAATGLLLACLFAAVYGVWPVVNSLFPGRGMEVYRLSRHGFFTGVGRDFWYIPGGTLRDYLRYEVAGWLVGTALLGAGGLLALARLVRRRGSLNDEIVLTCAVLHYGFVLLFFGNRFSWLYYYSLLILGLAALAARGRRQAAAVLLVALLVLIGSKAKFQATARLWQTLSATAETYGLWASPAERAEWRKVLELTRGRRPVVLLADVEGAAVLASDVFEPPAWSYLVPGHTVPAELVRKADQLAAAEMVVSTRRPPAGYAPWPRLIAALDGCEVIWQGPNFCVSRRVRPPAARR